MQAQIASGTKITVADMQKLQANNQPLDARAGAAVPAAARSNRRATAAPGASSTGLVARSAGGARRVLAPAELGLSARRPASARATTRATTRPRCPSPAPRRSRNSAAATLFAVWRDQAIRNTIDATLDAGRPSALRCRAADVPTSALKNLLDNFATRHGVGASGLNFFSGAGRADAGGGARLPAAQEPEGRPRPAGQRRTSRRPSPTRPTSTTIAGASCTASCSTIRSAGRSTSPTPTRPWLHQPVAATAGPGAAGRLRGGRRFRPQRDAPTRSTASCSAAGRRAASSAR